jgi:hypothetical protein
MLGSIICFSQLASAQSTQEVKPQEGAEELAKKMDNPYFHFSQFSFSKPY